MRTINEVERSVFVFGWSPRMKQLALGVIVLMFALSGRVSIVYIYCLLSIFIVYFQCRFLLSILMSIFIVFLMSSSNVYFCFLFLLSIFHCLPFSVSSRFFLILICLQPFIWLVLLHKFLTRSK